MKTIFCVVALLATFSAADNDNNNWPFYMGRCNRNDPTIDKCFIVYANEALRYILKGDTALGIPKLDQFTLEDVTLGKGQTWKLHFDTVTVSGFEHYYVVGMNWDFKKKKIDINFRYNSAQVCSGTYESNGTYGNRNINGKGNMDLVLVGGNYGGNSSYSMKYDLIKIGGRDYIQIKESKCVCQKGLRFNFDNILKSKKETESDRDYINSNTDIGIKAFMKDIADILCFEIDSVFKHILYNFPIDMIVFEDK